jgi:type II secretory pathway component GspD/PulD (secretin)
MSVSARKIAAILAAFVVTGAASSQEIGRIRTTVKHRPTFVQADFAEIAQSLGELTGRKFVLDPGVCALVTASWDKALTKEEFYQAFLEIARALGFVVVEEGFSTTIKLDDTAPRNPEAACPRYPASVAAPAAASKNR